MSRDAADLVAELRALSTADRLVDASAVLEPASQRCCGRPGVVFVAFEAWIGLRTCHYEAHLCPGCARQVIERAEADYVDVDVYVPATGGAA